MATLQQRVWQDLSKIDCSEFTEQKMGLTYLSWAHAYGILMDRWPNNTYYFREEQCPDGTMMVYCSLIIVDGEESALREMWLPVMDHRNKPVENPNAFQINTARMRCFTKCLSMHGLGSYIYKGEDLPKDDLVTDAQAESIEELLEKTKANKEKFLKAYQISSIEDLTQKQYTLACKQLDRKLEMLEKEAEDA